MSESEEDAIRRAVKRMTGYKDEADSDEAWEAWFEYVEGFGGLETFLTTAEAKLLYMELPVEIAGCVLLYGPPTTHTFDIQSQGPLGGKHGTLLSAEGDTAEIVGIGKIGWVGRRHLDVPIERHVDVFRELGFKEMVFPNGKRYEISDVAWRPPRP